MEPCVEREGLLIECSKIASDQIRDENHIPTVSRHRTRHDHKLSALQDRIAELLLTCAWGTRPQPIGIRYVGRRDNLNPSGVEDFKPRQNVWNRIERLECLVDGYFKNSSRWIE